MVKLTTEKIIQIHDMFMEQDKGTNEYLPGVRDVGTIYNFIDFQFDDNNSVFKNAAFALYSITYRHPFYNANKRTGFGIASMILESERYFINAKKQERLEYLLKIAEYDTTVEEIEDWLINNTRLIGKMQFWLLTLKYITVVLIALLAFKIAGVIKKVKKLKLR